MMHPKRKHRLTVIITILAGLGLALGLALYALRQNINLYYTPSQVVKGEAPNNQSLRLGGLVKKGSVVHAKAGLQVAFVVTDLVNNIHVSYEGILPDLFRDGQGVVVQGSLMPSGKFKATEVLAKHDEKYMPPIVNDALQQAKHITV